MENETASRTDEIYAKLVAGLKAGDFDWTHFLAEHGDNKAALYHAIGRFYGDMGPKLQELSKIQAELGQAETELKALNQKIRESDKIIRSENQDIAGLEEKQKSLVKQNEVLVSDLNRRRELLEQFRQLEKLGFSSDKLTVLCTTLTEIGSKRGLKSKKTVDTFFADLKDYQTIQGFKQELQSLDAVISSKRSETEKWRTEAETCETRYKKLQEAIDAIKSLGKQGVEPDRVVSWNNALATVGGVEELEKGLAHYKSIQGLLAACNEEQQQMDEKLAETSTSLKTLTQQKTELEASIKALRVSAIKEIEKVSEVSVEKINGLAQTESNSIRQVSEAGLVEMQRAFAMADHMSADSIATIRQVGETALGALKEALPLIDQVYARALEAGKTVEQVEAKLAKSKKIKDKTQALLRRVEGAG